MILFAALLFCTTANAKEDNEAFTLNRLGITDEKICDPVTCDMVESVIKGLTGNSVSPETAISSDVLKAMIKALDYDYKIDNKDNVEEYKELAEEIGLLDNFTIGEGAVSAKELTHLAFNALNTSKIEKQGYVYDPKFEENITATLMSSRFKAIYDSGVAEGYYGDGVRRAEPLNSNEYIINNERYIYNGPQKISDRHIRFAYVKDGGKNEIIAILNQHDITVHERTGNSGKRFIRRGIPFADGELMNANNLRLVGEDGFSPKLQCEVTERYESGYIKWVTVSFMLDIEADKKYYFDIETNAVRSEEAGKVKKETGGVMLDNGKMQLQTGKYGISSIIYNGKNLLASEGIRLAVADVNGDTHYLKTTSVETLADGGVFSEIRLHGKFEDMSTLADWIIRVCNEDLRIYHEVTFNTMGYTTLNGVYIEANFADEIQKKTFSESSENDGNIWFSDYIGLELGSECVTMSSQDFVRFEKMAKTASLSNGFVCDGESRILFAPMHYNAPFEWPDGVSRTVHLNMLLSDSALSEQELQRESNWAFTPPSLTVASHRFVNAGIIADDAPSAIAERLEEMVVNNYGKIWKIFQAGRFPNIQYFNYSDRSTTPSNSDRGPGESEYNMWLDYMSCQNERLYDMICESAEQWSDVVIYRGEEKLTYGCNRYFTGPYFGIKNGQFEMSQPFYGDLSGMYMTYLMTGERRYKDTFKIGVDNIEGGIAKNGVPTLSYWRDGKVVSHDTEYHARFMVQARGMMFAYRLFGEERFLEAGKSIARFLCEIQSPEGIFYESYDIVTKKPIPGTQGKQLQPHAKLYIMLYGARPMMDFYEMTGYEPALSCMRRLADFLLTEQEEDGWSWTPNSSNEIWDYGDERGCDGVTNSLITCFFNQMYDATGDVKYLEADLKALRFYTAAWEGKADNNYLGVNRSSFLKSHEKIIRMVKKNREKAIDMGYADVVALIDYMSAENTEDYNDFDNMEGRCVVNTFDTRYGKLIYFVTVATSHHSDTFRDKFIDLNFKISDEKQLWFGDKLRVLEDGVYLCREMEVVDLAHLMQTDIYITDAAQETEVQITEYTEDKITIELTGTGKAGLKISDGFFRIADGETVKISVGDKQSEYIVQNGQISAEIELDEGVTIATISR